MFIYFSIITSHCAQMFSMDTSYSKNVQWPTRQLQEFASVGASARTTASGDDWTTYAAFQESRGTTAAVAPGAEGAMSSSGGCSSAVPDASTRAPRAGFEVLFQPETQGTFVISLIHRVLCVSYFLFLYLFT
jgi:hypothetical protein